MRVKRRNVLADFDQFCVSNGIPKPKKSSPDWSTRRLKDDRTYPVVGVVGFGSLVKLTTGLSVLRFAAGAL